MSTNAGHSNVGCGPVEVCGWGLRSHSSSIGRSEFPYAAPNAQSSAYGYTRLRRFTHRIPEMNTPRFCFLFDQLPLFAVEGTVNKNIHCLVLTGLVHILSAHSIRRRGKRAFGFHLVGVSSCAYLPGSQ